MGKMNNTSSTSYCSTTYGVDFERTAKTDTAYGKKVPESQKGGKD
jgi:hypothetical protein